MKPLRTLIVVALLASASLPLSAREVARPEVFVPVKDALLNLVEFQVNKLDRACKLSDKQKETLAAIFVAEAEDLGVLQKEHRGDMTYTIPGTIEIVSRTNASILRLLTPDQQKVALPFIEERKTAFNNKLKITIEEMWRHQERLNNIPISFDPAAAS